MVLWRSPTTAEWTLKELLMWRGNRLFYCICLFLMTFILKNVSLRCLSHQRVFFLFLFFFLLHVFKVETSLNQLLGKRSTVTSGDNGGCNPSSGGILYTWTLSEHEMRRFKPSDQIHVFYLYACRSLSL